MANRMDDRAFNRGDRMVKASKIRNDAHWHENGRDRKANKQSTYRREAWATRRELFCGG